MVSANPSTESYNPRLIVAVDFGYRDLAVAWALTVSDPPKLTVMNRWIDPWGLTITEKRDKSVPYSPLQGDITDADFQVPNVVSYDENNHQLIGWGHTATGRVSWHQKSGVEQVELCNLQLMQYSEASIHPTEPSVGSFPRSDIEYFADFLSKLRLAVDLEITEWLKHDPYPEDKGIHYYFSLSECWSKVRKVALREGIIMAGWLRDEADDFLNFVPNTLAAATSSLEDNSLHLHTYEVILVINCGKDTLDVLVYEAGVAALEEVTDGSRATFG